MGTANTQVVLLLILLHVIHFGFSISYGSDNEPAFDYEYEDFGNVGDDSSTATTTEKTIFGKSCGLRTNEFCVKVDQCATVIRTPKIIIDLTKPRDECHYMETCCEQSKIKQSVSIINKFFIIILHYKETSLFDFIAHPT